MSLRYRYCCFTLTALLAVVAGCAPSQQSSDQLILPRLAPLADASTPSTVKVTSRGGVEVDPQQRQLLQASNSQREAVLTLGELSWGTQISTRDRPYLQANVAAMGVEGSTSEMVVEADGREIYRAAVTPGSWQFHELRLPHQNDAELVLRSDGESPIAWADVVLTWPARDQRPNLILISIDTLRADHLSSYGYERQTSVNLDRLADESLLFTRSYSTSTWTLPSTATLLTGLLPAQHNVRRRRDSLSNDIPTLARTLSDAGYRTVGFVDGGYLGFGWGLSLGFQSYTSGAHGRKRTDDVAEVVAEASSWLIANRFEPFFLFVQTYETHQPYRNREGFADPFLDPDGPKFQSANPLELLRNEEDDPAVWQRVKDLYDGEIARADHYLGKLFDVLRNRELSDNTSIIITSDHGEEFLEHGGVDHYAAKVFDENVRVPLIVRLPGQVEGKVVGTPVTGADVVPTFLDLAGVEASSELVGRSLRSLLGNRNRPVFIHGLSTARGRGQERIRFDDGSQSLILSRHEGTVELYERDRDPGMRQPLPVADSAQELRLQSLLAWMSKQGQAFVRLPQDVEMLQVPTESAIVPISVLQGLERRRIDAEAREIELDGRAAVLVFDIKGDGDLRLGLRVPGEATRSRVLKSERPAEGWSPIVELPEILRAFPTAQRLESSVAELDDESLRQLRALGYL